jgi:N-acetylmuramoyl-L-alanine amidase
MGRVTWMLRTPAAAGILLAAALAGCEPQGISGPSGELGPPRQTEIPVSDVASSLGMNLAHASYATATLRDGANTVVLYCDPEGEVYVNGVPIPSSGGITPHDGTLLVPAELLPRIQALLRSGRSEPFRVRPLAPAPVRPTVSPRRRSVGTVVIDPGHGGKDPGATSVLGAHEKHIVLAVARQLADQLRRRDVDVVLTRSDDRFLELEDRAGVATEAKADLFVSLHADSAKNPSASGCAAYVSRSANRQSLAAAGAILKRVGSSGTTSRGIRRADYRVLVHAKCPAVLVEIGFLSNRTEATRLVNASYQRRQAEALARGIVDFLQR